MKQNILNLYPEDFENFTIWEDVCDCLNMSYDSPMISISVNYAQDSDIIENPN